jgi:hypothetical protein
MSYVINSGQVFGLVMRTWLGRYRQAGAVPSVMLGYESLILKCSNHDDTNIRERNLNIQCYCKDYRHRISRVMLSLLWIQIKIPGLSPEKNPRIYRRDCGVWLWGKKAQPFETTTLFTAQHPEPVLSAVDHVFKSLFLFLTVWPKGRKGHSESRLSGTEPHCMIKRAWFEFSLPDRLQISL